MTPIRSVRFVECLTTWACAAYYALLSLGVLFLEESRETGAHSTATDAVCPVRTLVELRLRLRAVASGKQHRDGW
jgi:hypothetical protein